MKDPTLRSLTWQQLTHTWKRGLWVRGCRVLNHLLFRSKHLPQSGISISPLNLEGISSVCSHGFDGDWRVQLSAHFGPAEQIILKWLPRVTPMSQDSIRPQTAAEPLVADLAARSETWIRDYWPFCSQFAVTSRSLISTHASMHVCSMTRGACDATVVFSFSLGLKLVCRSLSTPGKKERGATTTFRLFSLHLRRWRTFALSKPTFLCPPTPWFQVSRLSSKITAAISAAALSRNSTLTNPSGWTFTIFWSAIVLCFYKFHFLMWCHITATSTEDKQYIYIY